MGERCVLSNEVLYLELVQVGTLFLLEVTNVGCTRMRLGTTMGGVPYGVCVQPALCALVWGQVNKMAQNGNFSFLCGLRAAGRDHGTVCGRRPLYALV